MKQINGEGATAGGRVAVRGDTPARLMAAALAGGSWAVKVRDRHGRVTHEDVIHPNLITNEGLDYLLDAGLAGGTQITSWYIGLLDGAPTVAAGDTMSSHAGWTEVTDYTEAARQAWTAGSVSGQSVDNSGAVASFAVNADSTTIGGAFLTSDDTKGGSTGTLYSGGAFSGGDIVLNDGSTLEITATFTQADA